MSDNKPHPFYGQAYVQVKTGIVPMVCEEVRELLLKKCPKTMRDAKWNGKVYEIKMFFIIEVSSERYTKTLSTEVLRVFPNATVRLADMDDRRRGMTHKVIIPKEEKATEAI